MTNPSTVTRRIRHRAPRDAARATAPPRARARVGPHPGSTDIEEQRQLADGFGAELRRLRVAQGLTQAQLAKAARCSRWQVSRLERGERRPEAGTVGRLVRMLVVGRQARQDAVTHLRELAGGSWRVRARKRAVPGYGRAGVQRRADALIARARARRLAADK